MCLRIEPLLSGGCLEIQVQDSGEGFDVARVLARPLDTDRLSGRGSVLFASYARLLAGQAMVEAHTWSFPGRLRHNPLILGQGVNKCPTYIWIIRS